MKIPVEVDPSTTLAELHEIVFVAGGFAADAQEVTSTDDAGDPPVGPDDLTIVIKVDTEEGTEALTSRSHPDTVLGDLLEHLDFIELDPPANGGGIDDPLWDEFNIPTEAGLAPFPEASGNVLYWAIARIGRTIHRAMLHGLVETDDAPGGSGVDASTAGGDNDGGEDAEPLGANPQMQAMMQNLLQTTGGGGSGGPSGGPAGSFG